MNDHVRKTVKEKMTLDRVTQTGLADDLHMSRTNLVRLLSGNAGQIPRRWAEVLDALGLELIAVPKDRADEMADDGIRRLPRRPVRYSDMTAEERKTRDELDKIAKLPKDVREIRRRYEVGELDDGLEMEIGGEVKVLPVETIERQLALLEDGTYSSNRGAILMLRTWFDQERGAKKRKASS